VFGKVGEDKPGLTARLQMVGESVQEAEQHPARGVVDGAWLEATEVRLEALIRQRELKRKK
jgi:hypothetical protein